MVKIRRLTPDIIFGGLNYAEKMRLLYDLTANTSARRLVGLATTDPTFQPECGRLKYVLGVPYGVAVADGVGVG